MRSDRVWLIFQKNHSGHFVADGLYSGAREWLVLQRGDDVTSVLTVEMGRIYFGGSDNKTL